MTTTNRKPIALTLDIDKGLYFTSTEQLLVKGTRARYTVVQGYRQEADGSLTMELPEASACCSVMDDQGKGTYHEVEQLKAAGRFHEVEDGDIVRIDCKRYIVNIFRREYIRFTEAPLPKRRARALRTRKPVREVLGSVSWRESRDEKGELVIKDVRTSSRKEVQALEADGNGWTPLTLTQEEYDSPILSDQVVWNKETAMRSQYRSRHTDKVAEPLWVVNHRAWLDSGWLAGTRTLHELGLRTRNHRPCLVRMPDGGYQLWVPGEKWGTLERAGNAPLVRDTTGCLVQAKWRLSLKVEPTPLLFASFAEAKEVAAGYAYRAMDMLLVKRSHPMGRGTRVLWTYTNGSTGRGWVKSDKGTGMVLVECDDPGFHPQGGAPKPGSIWMHRDHLRREELEKGQRVYWHDDEAPEDSEASGILLRLFTGQALIRNDHEEETVLVPRWALYTEPLYLDSLPPLEDDDDDDADTERSQDESKAVR